MKELLSRQAVHEKLCDEAGRRKSKLEIANKLKSSKSTIDEGNITSATTMPRTLDEEKASPPTVLTEKRKVRDEETDNATPHDETLAQSTLSATTKDPSPKKPVVVVTEQPAPYNFLSVGAKRAKLVRSARTAARVRPITSIGDITTAATISHTGSGVPLRNVIRLKFVKGFTQAVRTPCQIEDLV